MRVLFFVCLITCICFSGCVSTKPGFSSKNVLWLEQMRQLDKVETYEQFQSVAGTLNFYPYKDEKVKDTRIITYTRAIYVAKTKKTYTQFLSFYINFYIPRVAFSTPHMIYPTYSKEFKAAALKQGFGEPTGSNENYTMIRLSDMAKFQMTEEYNTKTGITTYMLIF